jgi:hypothetical protein
MTVTLTVVNEGAHVELNDVDLGATDSPFFVGPDGEQFVLSTASKTPRKRLSACWKEGTSEN